VANQEEKNNLSVSSWFQTKCQYDLHYGNVLFMKVENWKTVNLSPKCTKLRLKFQNFPGGNTPDPLSWGICAVLNNR